MCELFTLNQVLKFLKEKEGAIYTNSKYTFRVAQMFGKIWTEWGLISHKGQDLVCKERVKNPILSPNSPLPLLASSPCLIPINVAKSFRNDPT